MAPLTSTLAAVRVLFPRVSRARALGIAVIGLCSTVAAHGQATIADCEKISAADAYNQCLAKFGPASKSGNLQPERPGDVKSSSDEAAASAGPAKGASKGASARRGRRGRVHSVRRGGGGRKRMTFTVRRSR